MKKSKTNNIYQPKLNQTKTIIQHPFKLKEKLKLINNDQSSNINKIKISDKNFLKKFSYLHLCPEAASKLYFTIPRSILVIGPPFVVITASSPSNVIINFC